MLLRDLSQCGSCRQVTDAASLGLLSSGVKPDGRAVSLRQEAPCRLSGC